MKLAIKICLNKIKMLSTKLVDINKNGKKITLPLYLNTIFLLNKKDKLC